MRVFVAAPCPDSLIPFIHQQRLQLDGVVGVEHVADSGLHMTIIPPWEDRNPDAVIRDLAAVSCGPLELAFVQLGYGSDAHEPELAWLLGERTDAVDRLWLQTWRAIQSHDPARAVFPHITMSYVPQGAVLPELDSSALPVTGQIDRLAVYASLGAHRYEKLGERLL